MSEGQPDLSVEELDELLRNSEQIDHQSAELAKFRARIDQFEQQLEQLHERIDQLEYANERLVTDLPTQTRSKREKCFAIVRRVVEDSKDNAIRGTIGKKKAAGVADCSDRHALNLFAEIAEHDWATKNTEKAQADETKLDVEFGEDKHAFLETVRTEFAVEAEP